MTRNVRTTREAYYLGSQRMAMRVAPSEPYTGTIYWIHGDHLDSASLTTNITGTTVSEMRYYPFGETRWVSGTMPTDRQFTGQRNELYAQRFSPVYDLGARFFDPTTGTFLSSDPIVPSQSEPQDWNRYAYARNNPLKYVDPSGYDPLSQEWVDEFTRLMGHKPGSMDELVRLFSYAYPEEWDFDKFYVKGPIGIFDFRLDDRGHTIFEDTLTTPPTGRTWADFPDAVNRLSAMYFSQENALLAQDVSALWAGTLTRGEGTMLDALTRNAQEHANAYLNPNGLASSLNDRDADNNVHHFGAFFMAGFTFGARISSYVNEQRERAQAEHDHHPVDQQDILMGNTASHIGTEFGSMVCVFGNCAYRYSPGALGSMIQQYLGITP